MEAGTPTFHDLGKYRLKRITYRIAFCYAARGPEYTRQRDRDMEPSTSPTLGAFLRSVSLRLRWYGLAVMLSVLALLLMILLRPLMESSIFLLFIAAVTVSALYGGLGPGLVATVLSALASDFYFLPPWHTLLGEIEDVLRLGIFVAVGLIISWLCAMHRRADDQLRTLNENLERQVAESRALQRQLEHKASHDYLTDLPNRQLFFEHLARALARARRQGGKVALLLMDLDDFKLINDSFGHQTGDKVLVEVAGRLKGFLRDADMGARLGGDEFTVVLEDVVHASEPLGAAERFHAQLRAPIGVDGHKVHTSVSIGIAVGAEEQPEELVHAADLAMYQAKSGGKARSVLLDL